MSKATLKTIAEYTGLSVTTVSRALKDGDDVKQPTKEKVKAAAEKLGYRPNLSGLGLRTGINYNICAILPVTKPGDIVGDVGTLALISGLTAGLEGTPFHLTVLPLEPEQDPLEPVKYAVENNLAGGIIFNLTQTQDERVTYLHEQKIPFVTFGQTEMSVEHSFVDIDNYDIGYRAASYLYSKGRKNIRLVSSSHIYTYCWHKFYGVKRASMEYGTNFSKDTDIIFDTEVKNYRTYAKEMMESDVAPDGIICGSEISACGMIAGVQDAGKVIGKDVDIIAVETCDLPSFFTPPIPGLRQDMHSVGKKLSSFIVKCVEGTDATKLQYIEKTTLHER
ncbi:LacI family DNA-binding transcriptional regulator [Vibrio parahaemolyticus]|uniref:LacI family DNA-binding transcriptional regulator n=1 Tax=Vibrio parahaemolyticus TaxID=670 RepID=UPI00215BB7AC|nr:LacI family DNA-binding transcriptional regulator [Vibrio parahaemolyticus]MCR9817942.1 LacI family DNA-binding transcriptional regulator [Vibrio parahaemolyticus]